MTTTMSFDTIRIGTLIQSIHVPIDAETRWPIAAIQEPHSLQMLSTMYMDVTQFAGGPNFYPKLIERIVEDQRTYCGMDLPFMYPDGWITCIAKGKDAMSRPTLLFAVCNSYVRFQIGQITLLSAPRGKVS